MIALGCIIRGETMHFDYLARAVANGLDQVGRSTGVAVAFGVLTVDNPFITRRRIRDIAVEDMQVMSDDEISAREYELYDTVTPEMLDFDKPIEPRPTLTLDDNMSIAIQKMEQLDTILESLPGLDCGSCGAPNCRAGMTTASRFSSADRRS